MTFIFSECFLQMLMFLLKLLEDNGLQAEGLNTKWKLKADPCGLGGGGERGEESKEGQKGIR